MRGCGLTPGQIEGHLDKLKDHIANCRQKGFSSESIKTQLLGAGWPEDVLLPLLAEPVARPSRKIDILSYRALPVCGVVAAAFIILVLLAYVAYLKPVREIKEAVVSLPEVEEFLNQHPDAELTGKMRVANDSLAAYGVEMEEQPVWRVSMSDGERNVTVFLGGDSHPLYVVEDWKCGDGTCDPKENCEVCSADCGCPAVERCEERLCVTYCGNSVCDPDEECSSCRGDCAVPGNHSICVGTEATWVDSCGYQEGLRENCTGEKECFGGECRPRCGNGLCDADYGEDCSTCAADCGCGESERCENAMCVTFCGNGRCELEENCASCDTDCGCGEFGRCEEGKCQIWCGNGRCDADESCGTCLADCGCNATQQCESALCANFCGNGICESDENCGSCDEDCGCSAIERCEDAAECVTFCGNGVCESSGEGCGSCTADCTCSQASRCRSDACAAASGTERDTVAVGETRTYSIAGRSYEVTLTFVYSGKAKFTVNGVSTSLIDEGGIGVLSDGTELKLFDVLYQAYAGGIQSADFSLTTYG